MSEYAKNIQKIEDMWKKRIRLRGEGVERISEYIIAGKVDRWDGLATGIVAGEIVRCRDCKYYMDYEHEFEPNLGYCREFDREEVRDSCFCAWGERLEP